MSFSSQVKEELSKLNNLASKAQVQAELTGYLISDHCRVSGDTVKYATESKYNINRFSKLLNNMGILDYTIDMQGKSFVISFARHYTNWLAHLGGAGAFITETGEDTDCLKALVRGLFLGAGAMNNPENEYHLAAGASTGENAKLVQNELEKVGIRMKILSQKNSATLYLKDGEEISRFLAFIGANSAMLKFEEVRVLRHMNNKVNRLVNCETANMNKTINAAVEQIEAIQHLKKVKVFDKLDENLKEIAEVRLAHPDSALSELGGYLKKPIGKSGVNYRLKRIIEIAKEN